jgi:prepilin signal peptidase PulO-like enzyme (type II secretory pathway)
MIEIAIGIYISLILIVTSISDIRNRIIPHKLMIPALVMGLTLRVLHHEIPLISHFIAFFMIGGLLYIVALISVNGMGGGDITLGAFVGLMLGLPWSFVAIVVGVLLGTCYGLIKMLQVKTIKIGIPLAPFIAIGTLFSYWFGQVILLNLEPLYLINI